MADRKEQELEIKHAVFAAVLDGVRTGQMEHPALVLRELTAEAIGLLLGPAEGR